MGWSGFGYDFIMVKKVKKDFGYNLVDGIKVFI